MKFRFVKEVEGKVRTYSGLSVRTGDVVELDEVFSEKAVKNPDFETVNSPATDPVVKRTKKQTKKRNGNKGRG